MIGTRQSGISLGETSISMIHFVQISQHLLIWPLTKSGSPEMTVLDSREQRGMSWLRKSGLLCVTILKHRNQTFTLITSRKRSLGQDNMFTGVCLSTGGDAWSGGCLVQGGAWSQGGCLLQGRPDGDPSGRLLLRRYASYWNAFLFQIFSPTCSVPLLIIKT